MNPIHSQETPLARVGKPKDAFTTTQKVGFAILALIGVSALAVGTIFLWRCHKAAEEQLSSAWSYARWAEFGFFAFGAVSVALYAYYLFARNSQVQSEQRKQEEELEMVLFDPHKMPQNEYGRTEDDRTHDVSQLGDRRNTHARQQKYLLQMLCSRRTEKNLNT